MSQEKGKSEKEVERTQEFCLFVLNSCLPVDLACKQTDPTYKMFIFKPSFEGLTSHCHFFPYPKPPKNFFLHL